MQTELINLPSPAPGLALQLTKHTFGHLSSGNTAYLQAGLHADEHPGLLVLQHLIPLLEQCEAEGRLKGGVVIIPVANPPGLSQNVFGHLTGRFSLANGENFNRNFYDLHRRLTAEGAESLNSNSLQACREYVSTLMAARQPEDAISAMKHTLLSEALKHDLVIDLHCDLSGILHLYSNRLNRERAVTLAAYLGAEVVLEEEMAGGQPFDESVLRCWQWFAEHKGLDAREIPFTVTVELRGQADVSDELAAADARALLHFLESQGIIDAAEPVSPHTGAVNCYPLEGVSHLQAPQEGIICWKKRPGDKVAAGELLAEVVSLSGGQRQPVESPHEGILVTRPLIKYVRAGQSAGMLAGHVKQYDRQGGTLLSD